jgi:hypothetical protein
VNCEAGEAKQRHSTEKILFQNNLKFEYGREANWLDIELGNIEAKLIYSYLKNNNCEAKQTGLYQN